MIISPLDTPSFTTAVTVLLKVTLCPFSLSITMTLFKITERPSIGVVVSFLIDDAVYCRNCIPFLSQSRPKSKFTAIQLNCTLLPGQSEGGGVTLNGALDVRVRDLCAPVHQKILSVITSVTHEVHDCHSHGHNNNDHYFE